MSLNTVPIRPEDWDRSKILRKELLDGTISINDAYELERILENEKNVAYKEGNIDILAAINYFQNLLDNFLAKHNKKRRLQIIPFKISNIDG